MQLVNFSLDSESSRIKDLHARNQCLATVYSVGKNDNIFPRFSRNHKAVKRFTKYVPLSYLLYVDIHLDTGASALRLVCEKTLGFPSPLYMKPLGFRNWVAHMQFRTLHCMA